MSYVLRCEACNRSMSMSDLMFERRVAGKQVTLKCKACMADIRIDGVALAAKLNVGPVNSFAPSGAGPQADPPPAPVPRAAATAPATKQPSSQKPNADAPPRPARSAPAP